jgi:hypothetical protein
MISVTRASRFTGVGRGMIFPPFIVNLLRIYKSRLAAGIRFAIEADTKELRAEHRPVKQRLQLRFRERCADGGGRCASLRVLMFGLQ